MRMIYPSVSMMQWLAILLFAGCQPKVNGEETPHKPNILFLFTDDYTYDAIHALGNEVIHTPNLDRLAESGVSFTHAYNMGSWTAAVCLASRAMIMSGRSVWEAEAQSGRWEQKDDVAASQNWGQLMREQGYNTYMTGKWHVNHPAERVFDLARHVRPGMPKDHWDSKKTGEMKKLLAEGRDIQPLMPRGYSRPISPADTSWLPADTLHGGYWEGGQHWSEVVKEDAMDFIADAAQKQDPFFMYVAFNAPHDPRQAPQKFLDRYPLESIPLPGNWLSEYPYHHAIGCSRFLRDEMLAPFPRTPHAIKTHLKEYYAIITHLDAQIGDILDALEASGKADNTYVFFTADHGLSVGRHGLLGKQNLFDHSIRVPLIVTGPGIPGNQKRPVDIYLQDIMATSLELAGVPKPDYLFFNSFLDIAQGKAAEGAYDEEGIYGAYIDFQRMIRKDDFKLIVYPKINKVLLFDMKNDPGEMHDLASLPLHRKRVRSMFTDLLKLQAKMNDPMDLKSMYDDL